MPKRVGNLMPRIASLENLHEAFLRTMRGKEGKQTLVRYREQLNDNLMQMQRELLDGTFRFGRYNFFEITDQKRRTICAASLPENIAFHAMMRICHPVFDNFQMYSSFASRPEKGTHKALAYAQKCAGRYQWFAKLDVCKFFYNISHEVMMGQLCRLFKDPVLLLHFQHVIDSYEASAGRGLPIGNLTSQYFANHYLAVADHWGKECLHVANMVRYMDDVILFSDQYDELMRQVRTLTRFMGDELQLELHAPIVNRTKFGIPFLGYVVYWDDLRLTQRSQRRYRMKMYELARSLTAGEICDMEYVQRAQCLVAFVEKADSSGYRHFLERVHKGIYPKELPTA